MKSFLECINEKVDRTDIDPYREENWNTEEYSVEQQEYLAEVWYYLGQFRNCYHELNNLWTKDIVDINEILGGDDYPFDEYFEDLGIDEWWKNFDNFMKNKNI